MPTFSKTRTAYFRSSNPIRSKSTSIAHTGLVASSRTCDTNGNKYLYFRCFAGFNDLLCGINRALDYCVKHNRILLIDTLNSGLQVNFSDYFSFQRDDIICDINKITEICSTDCTVYPAKLKGKMTDILNGTFPFKYKDRGKYLCCGAVVDIPYGKNIAETIIISCEAHGGNGYLLFKQLNIVDNDMKKICNDRYNLLKTPYLCIQIRNTDYKCDYEQLYKDNKDLIHSYDSIYIATDDKNALDFFRNKNLVVNNYATFPSGEYFNLHCSNINPRTKIIDMMSDVFIIAMSDKLISNSKGNFIKLAQNCRNNKIDVYNQFKILNTDGTL